MNVTVPLQCLVDEGNSMIIIKGGMCPCCVIRDGDTTPYMTLPDIIDTDSSKSELEGFYDPLDEGTSQLYVKYVGV